MTKQFCDRCGKEISLVYYKCEISKHSFLLYSKKDFELCDDCRKEFFKFMNWKHKDLAEIKPPTSSSNIQKAGE